jgi:dienelactone hydrolase
MKHIIPLLVLLLVPAILTAQPPFDWPELTQKPYAGKPIPDLGLRPLLEKEGATKEDWQAARKGLEKQWRERLGPMPVRPKELAARVEQVEKCDGYTRQLVSFLSADGDRILAYLLIPDGIGEGQKRPAVVVFHPTTAETLKQPAGLGKDPSMALGVHLVKRGYVVLCPECYIMKEGGPKAQAEAVGKAWPGLTGLGKMVFDASRCIDFLESLPFVDAGRIGCIGHSLGAKEVLFAMAFEPRFQAGVFNEGGVGLRMSNWTDPWYLTAKMKDHIPAMENHQVLALCAPRPILILGGDSADGDASWPFVRAALPVYQLLGAGDRIGLINHHGKHTFPEPARRLAYQWLDHWLGMGTPMPPI